MAHRPWNDNYIAGHIPWDTGAPDPLLVAFVAAGAVASGRALDIGAGTGSNVRWLAAQGFDALGIDIAPRAIELARDKASGPRCRFEVGDILAAPPAGPFDLVFDRGCFHVFDDADDRARFAANVAQVLAPGGVWLSLIGSTEGEPRDHGPPRRSARDVVAALEPVLAIESLSAAAFTDLSPPWTAWRCVARLRDTPDAPSSR